MIPYIPLPLLNNHQNKKEKKKGERTDLACLLNKDNAELTSFSVGELLQLNSSTETSGTTADDDNVGLVSIALSFGGVLGLLLGLLSITQTGQGSRESAKGSLGRGLVEGRSLLSEDGSLATSSGGKGEEGTSGSEVGDSSDGCPWEGGVDCTRRSAEL